jgi:hypothetical protein
MLTVTTEAESQDLTALGTVKAELGILDGSKDEPLTTFIHQASAIAARYCNRVFGQETVTETFRLVGCRPSLSLTRYPVASVSSVIEGPTGSTTTLDTDEYEVDADSGLLYRLSDDCRIDWSATKYVVTYAGGYELLADLPQDIERGVIEIVKLLYHAAARDPLVKSESVSDLGSQDFWVGGFGNDALPPKVTALLDYYRRPCI